MSTYPYADRYPVVRGLPEEGRDRESILGELREMATTEDAFWHTGKASGSFYCGDMDHYAFMSEAFGLYGHMNALQRDVCPSATRFEGEIIAMGLDLFNASAADGGEPAAIRCCSRRPVVRGELRSRRRQDPAHLGDPQLEAPTLAPASRVKRMPLCRH